MTPLSTLAPAGTTETLITLSADPVPALAAADAPVPDSAPTFVGDASFDLDSELIAEFQAAVPEEGSADNEPAVCAAAIHANEQQIRASSYNPQLDQDVAEPSAAAIESALAAPTPAVERLVLDASPLLQRFGKEHRKKERSPRPERERKPRVEKPAQIEVIATPAAPYASKFAHAIAATLKPRQDEVDVINVSHLAQSELGKLLAINALSPFRHEVLGAFKSLGGMWYFLLDPEHNNLFRNLYGRICRTEGRKFEQRRVEGFKTLIAEGAWAKVLGNERLREMLVASTLPFASFHQEGDTLEAHWYCKILEAIRNQLKECAGLGTAPTPPDFRFLEERPAHGRREQRPGQGQRRDERYEPRGQGQRRDARPPRKEQRL